MSITYTRAPERYLKVRGVADNPVLADRIERLISVGKSDDDILSAIRADRPQSFGSSSSKKAVLDRFQRALARPPMKLPPLSDLQ